MYKHTIVVRFNDCDALGHVNNATYFTYFEDARRDLFRIFNPELDVQNWNLIVASTKCDFLQQVAYAETLTVYTWITRLGSSSFDVDHAMQDRTGRWVARGKATMLGFNFTTQTPAPLTPTQRAALSEHTEGPADAPEMRG